MEKAKCEADLQLQRPDLSVASGTGSYSLQCSSSKKKSPSRPKKAKGTPLAGSKLGRGCVVTGGEIQRSGYEQERY